MINLLWLDVNQLIFFKINMPFFFGSQCTFTCFRVKQYWIWQNCVFKYEKFLSISSFMYFQLLRMSSLWTIEHCSHTASFCYAPSVGFTARRIVVEFLLNFLYISCQIPKWIKRPNCVGMSLISKNVPRWVMEVYIIWGGRMSDCI